MLISFRVTETFSQAFSHKRSPLRPGAHLGPPQHVKSSSLEQWLQPLTNVKKNSDFLCGGDSRYSADTVKLGKTLWAMPLQKLWRSPFLVVKRNLTCRFTSEETGFISFEDLSCILRSRRIFRQYLKFHAFSILATQLTRWAVRIQKVWNFSRALTQNGLNIWVFY